MDEDEAGSPSSDQEISIREAEKEFNIHYDGILINAHLKLTHTFAFLLGDRSPYSDTEFFPLAKSTSTVKKRQYRTPDDLTSYGSVSSSNRDKYRDRDRHKRKHQQSRSPHPSSSAHSHSSSNKGREIRRNVSSGRSSPMMTHEGQWRREPSWDRDSSYPSERDERYKHRSRHQRGVEQGRVEAREASRQYQRGRDNRGHDSRDRVRSRSPLQREVRREGRRDYDHYHLPTGGGGGEERREKRGRAHQERWRREHSPLRGSHHPMVSEEEEEGEEVDSGSETGREKGGGQLSLHTHNVERLIHELLSGSSDSSNDDHKQRVRQLYKVTSFGEHWVLAINNGPNMRPFCIILQSAIWLFSNHLKELPFKALTISLHCLCTENCTENQICSKTRLLHFTFQLQF